MIRDARKKDAEEIIALFKSILADHRHDHMQKKI